VVVSYSGSGTAEDPIRIVGVSNNYEAVQAEYQYLQKHFGVQNRDWKLVRQVLLKTSDGRMNDLMVVRQADGRQVEIRFDITEYFGKW
jgi:hypothetical protein